MVSNRFSAYLTALFFMLNWCVSAEQTPVTDTVIVGDWQVEYLITDPYETLVPVACKTLGYTQEVKRIHRGYRIIVTCHLDPIILDSSMPEWSPENLPDEPQLIESLNTVNNINTAVRSVLGWIDNKIPYSDNPQTSQSVESVLENGQANCVGRTNTAISILGALGINARAVRGCLYQNGDSFFHRWLEIDYPGIGSLPSEPGTSQDYVTPYHLVLLPSDKTPAHVNKLSSLGVSIRKVSESRKIWSVDKILCPESIKDPLNRRQVKHSRHHASLTGQVTPASANPCQVIISNSSVTWSLNSDEFGCFSFCPIQPDQYQISVSAPGYDSYSQNVTVGRSEQVQLNIPCVKQSPGGYL